MSYCHPCRRQSCRKHKGCRAVDAAAPCNPLARWPKLAAGLAAKKEAALIERLPRELADKIVATLGELEGYTPPETPQDWTCVGASQVISALCLLLTAPDRTKRKCENDKKTPSGNGENPPKPLNVKL